MDDIEEVTPVIEAICIGLVVATFLLNTGRALKAIELCNECLIFLNNEVLRKKDHFVYFFTTTIYRKIFKAYCLLSDYTNAIKYGRELLDIYHECGETARELNTIITLADIHHRKYKYAEARELYERAINIADETDDREREAYAFEQFGNMSFHLGECDQAIEYLEKALAINIEISDKAKEATCYGNLGTVLQSLGEYEKAREYLEKALAISIDIGYRAGEAESYRILGTVFKSLGEYDKAREYFHKQLAIRIEIGDRAGEAESYGNLGTLFKSLGEYDKAKEYYEKALAISIEIGDREGEASCYVDLGTVFQPLGKYDKATEYLQKALAIRIKTGDKAGEASCYGKLGTVFESLGEYDKAREYLQKALAITIKIGDKAGEATNYGNLGTLFESLGEYDKAKEYFQKALANKIEIGDRAEEASCYGNLGSVFLCVREYDKAKEYIDKALSIKIEIGDRAGEGTSHGKLGTVFQSLGEYDKAKEHYEKALSIAMEIGDRSGEAKDCNNLGTLFHLLGEHVKAESYVERALQIGKDTGDAADEFTCFCNLMMVKLSLGKMKEALSCLLLSINKSEDLRGFLKDDQFKIAWSHVNNFPYRVLSAFFCVCGNTNNALYVLELARARALADLMATQYAVKRQISADSQSWIGIEDIMKNESNCACLYISYYDQEMFLWILHTSGAIHFRRVTVNENVIGATLVSSLDDFLVKSLSSLSISSQLDCEDRSLNNSELEPKLSADLRLVEDDYDDNQDPKLSLPLLYKMIIAPVADLLKEPEIIIVPDRVFYQVPFAALSDECGEYLSETFKIRIVPSLSTLKLIQDSPANYHSHTGALIVGDPEVGLVVYKGGHKTLLPLPCARKEAEMIGQLLRVQPLLGLHATKKAVLQKIISVSLIHFAAHASAERGEIALSPANTATGIPEEEDYLLTMTDISQVRLQANLVVLSCCHSGCGQIRAEGVIGIARAFLGSGARSVLVALWAIDDIATEQFMRRFYEHLIRGESASESLHEAMKWMRSNGFTKDRDWAPFMLIGDNVKFDFRK